MPATTPRRSPANRRAFLTATAATVLTSAGSATHAAAAPATGRPAAGRARPATGDEALAALLEGNRRWARVRSRHPHEDRARRVALAHEQHPFATILSCVDSRVPPELVFDQGLGDLLCIRTAGEVLDEAVLGSLQFGVTELRIPLILVLGHERCGAVAATIDQLRTGTRAPGHLARLVEGIGPSAWACRDEPGDWVDHTVAAHARRMRDALRADAAFRPAKVVAARFDLDSGRVRVLP
ncbi:carbonic anhydrase [Streptomyces flavofungini]|uniref:Carbonic anhydrase n=1 Tax=Streptomyces flavofungini TaxID=68200 RepID=A0ABS0XC79_9ACTN|nr:carbonic anhydrase [Streptomyces flavofungini]MBJ3810821.1 carbonic anhydrase [Streptomyces flavofungini]GHC62368.1 carbonic anhydrase [Streptomyces flavofungini]